MCWHLRQFRRTLLGKMFVGLLDVQLSHSVSNDRSDQVAYVWLQLIFWENVFRPTVAPRYKIHDSPVNQIPSRQWFAIRWFRPARTSDLNMPNCFQKFFRISILPVIRCYNPGMFGSPFCRCLENVVSHDVTHVWRYCLKWNFIRPQEGSAMAGSYEAGACLVVALAIC